MIQVQITTTNREQAVEIADYLVIERLILDAVIIDAEKRIRGDDEQIKVETQYLVLGKTKALLFETIDHSLRGKYPSKLPTIYSVPIVHMDWDQSSELKEKTAKV